MTTRKWEARSLPKVQIQFDNRKSAVFTPGGKKRYSPSPGDAFINADLIAADGTRYDAILEIDEYSSGEHCGTLIFTPAGLADQHDQDFLQAIGKTAEEFYPYRYRLRTAPACDDIHTGADGWSR